MRQPIERLGLQLIGERQSKQAWADPRDGGIRNLLPALAQLRFLGFRARVHRRRAWLAWSRSLPVSAAARNCTTLST